MSLYVLLLNVTPLFNDRLCMASKQRTTPDVTDALLKMITCTSSFLVHHANGNESFCNPFASVVRSQSSVDVTHFNLLL